MSIYFPTAVYSILVNIIHNFRELTPGNDSSCFVEACNIFDKYDHANGKVPVVILTLPLYRLFV